MKKKRRLDNDEIDQDTVHRLVAAFKEGAAECKTPVATMPSDWELEGTAMIVLSQECNDGRVRDSARDETHRLDYAAYGKCTNKWIYPEYDCCPTSLPEFDSLGGKLFMEDTALSVGASMRVCMRRAYVGWFNEHTLQVS